MSSKAAIEAEVFEGRDGVLVDEFHTGIEVGDDDYLLALLGYVERNPVRAGLVERAEARKWSSACPVTL